MSEQNPFIWQELVTPDQETSGTFFSKLFGWKLKKVDDVDDCAKQTEALGGEVLVPPHDVPDVGRVCAVSDPTGAVVHFMQPMES